MAQQLETEKQIHRIQRCKYFMAPVEKSTASCGVYKSPFIREYDKRNPEWMSKKDFTTQLTHGLIQEGHLSIKQLEIVNEFPKLSLEQVGKKCASLYTMPCSFYQHVNNILRRNDLSKVDTYGPFCCALDRYLGQNEMDIDEEPIRVLYRGTDLESEHLDEYKKNIGKVRSWLGFSSASTKENVAHMFSLNTLFVISPATIATPYFPGRLINKTSYFSEEEEILLQPGVDFRIEEVIESVEQNKKHIIHLTLL
jgi:hypothetical protein